MKIFDKIKENNSKFLNIKKQSSEEKIAKGIGRWGSKIIEKNKNYIKIKYHVQGTHSGHYIRTIPLKVKLDNFSLKCIGLWVGDNCDAPDAVGLSNKNLFLLKDFSHFLQKYLHQPKEEIILKIIYGKKANLKDIKNIERKNDFSGKIQKYQRKSKLHENHISTSVKVANRGLYRILFKYFKENPKELLEILTKKERMAFYAGLFEAEGTVRIDKNYVCLEFGQFISKEFSKMLQNYLVKDGFQSQITRKLDKRTNKYFYTIRLATNKKTRKSDLKNFEQILKVMNKNTEKYQKAERCVHQNEF